MVTLTVTVDGPGTIVSDPAGISCGSTCSATFPLGTVVGLHAQPQAAARAVGFEAAFVDYPGSLCSSGDPRCWFTLATDAQATGKFVPVSTSPTCKDGQKNGTETDIDCGGSCGPCGLDAACQKSSDCGSGQCVMGLCTACPLNKNLLWNGDAESDVPGSTAPGWTLAQGFAIDGYGGGNLSGTEQNLPASRGKNFFYGGVSAQSTAAATVDLSKCARLIERQAIKLTVSGYLGGYAGQNDNIAVRFGIQQGASVTSQLTLGPVLASDRGGASGLLLREASAVLPKGACSVDVVITATRTEGVSNDGYADNLTAMVSLQ